MTVDDIKSNVRRVYIKINKFKSMLSLHLNETGMEFIDEIEENIRDIEEDLSSHRKQLIKMSGGIVA